MKLIEKLDKYIKITQLGLKELKISKERRVNQEEIKDLLNLAISYYKDALYFKGKKDFVNAFAAINYAHAFLDAGARLKLFKVKEKQLFMIE